MDNSPDTYGMSIDRQTAIKLKAIADHYGMTIPETLDSVFNIGMDMMIEAMERIPRHNHDQWPDLAVGSPW